MKKIEYMIQTASLVGLVKTVLIIILAYLIFKYITRLLAPWILRSLANKMAKKFHRPPSNYNSTNEGDVSVDKSVKKQRSKKDFGEYVDYEELD